MLNNFLSTETEKLFRFGRGPYGSDVMLLFIHARYLQEKCPSIPLTLESSLVP